MLSQIDESVKFTFGDINLSNIELAASTALEALTNEALERNMCTKEFAYILYSMNEDSIAYKAVFSLELMYGKIPQLERENIVDSVSDIYYRLAHGVHIDENEYASIFRPTYQRLSIPMPQ